MTLIIKKLFQHYKRAIGDGNGGQAEQSQQDAGIFPKFPGDEDEFEQESQVQGQDDNIPPLDKDKLQEGQDNFGISGNNGFVGEESSSLPPADTESNDIGDEGQSSQNSGFEDVGQQDSYQGGKGSGSWYGKEREEDNEIDVTTERQQHKPWYKKVHGFLKNQYNYIKSRVGRADDYYVNQ